MSARITARSRDRRIAARDGDRRIAIEIAARRIAIGIVDRRTAARDMGHRALVAYRRPDGRYDLRYSHWGADALALRERIAVETPLGSGAVDPTLRAGSVPFGRVLSEHLDPRVYEALYLVSTAFAVDAYCVCWLAWDDGPARGAIVPVESPERAATLRSWLRATKTALADVVELGALSRAAARSYLEERVSEERDGRRYTYRGANGDGGSATVDR